MYKLIILLFLPFIGVSQVTKVSNLNMYYPFDFKYSGKTPQGDSTWDGRLFQPFIDSLRNAVATNNTQSAQITSLSSQGVSNTAAITTLTNDLKTANERIARLEALAPGLPVPVEVTTNSYTITPNDNGKTIYVYTNATITLNIQGAGFKCKVIRMGTGRPRFVTSGITLRLRANFTPLSVQYQAVELEWKEGEVVIQ